MQAGVWEVWGVNTALLACWCTLEAHDHGIGLLGGITRWL